MVGHPHEKALVGYLMLALDKVDNTVGHFQAYLKTWCDRSFKRLTLLKPVLPEKRGRHLQHLVGDALTLEYPPADIAYIDPPYSAHSYQTYFHVWDSLAMWDKPQVALKTNRRIDRVGKDNRKSLWNSKKTAGQAFDALFKKLCVKYILVSYSEDALLPLDMLKNIAEKHGEVSVFTYTHPKNIRTKIGKGEKNEPPGTLKEYILLIRK
jgi:adenine-specific DNA-methyltransferase